MPKKLLIDIGHPAQVHNFKYVYWEMKKRGWEAIFTAKDKEMTLYLLEKYSLPFLVIGRTRKGILKKTFDLISAILRFYKVLHYFKPDIIICRFSPHASWIGWLKNIPVVGLADTEHTRLLDKLTVRFVTAKLSAYTYYKNLGKNHIRFNGNIELFYLHPNRFNLTNELIKPHLDYSTKYALIRFVSWEAHHDIGEQGLTLEEKVKIIKILEGKFKVYITSEKKLPKSLEKYRLKTPPEVIHNVLANASIYVGEGASMASEAACLGVPAVYINTLNTGYVQEEAEYGLVFNFRNTSGLFKTLLELLETDDLKASLSLKHENFLKDKIDVTGFLAWFIENYPDSLKIMKYNPDYQYNFR